MHASVYKCFKKGDDSKEHPFAVKIAREEDEEKILVHEGEFNIMHSLDHPYVVKSYELFVDKVKNEIH